MLERSVYNVGGGNCRFGVAARIDGSVCRGSTGSGERRPVPRPARVDLRIYLADTRKAKAVRLAPSGRRRIVRDIHDWITRVTRPMKPILC